MSPQNPVERRLCERFVKSFLDIIVLKEMGKGNPIGGHDIQILIYKRFHVLISSGIIYPLLYSMERNRLIEGMRTTKKRVYRLTERGKERLENILDISDRTLSFIKSIFGK